ncbi:PspC domain-containing protein [Novosphingobium sp.]|uniref:PspC domain-containing protein n=1 Tax=Novosphingobium sp. TaxID=1874826 RepID=UPI0035AF3AF8
MSALRSQSSGNAPVGGGFRLGKGNAKFMGVCSGIADYFGLDVTLVRIGVVVATLVGVGSLIPIYLAIGLIAD